MASRLKADDRSGIPTGAGKSKAAGSAAIPTGALQFFSFYDFWVSPNDDTPGSGCKIAILFSICVLSVSLTQKVSLFQTVGIGLRSRAG